MRYLSYICCIAITCYRNVTGYVTPLLQKVIILHNTLPPTLLISMISKVQNQLITWETFCCISLRGNTRLWCMIGMQGFQLVLDTSHTSKPVTSKFEISTKN